MYGPENANSVNKYVLATPCLPGQQGTFPGFVLFRDRFVPKMAKSKRGTASKRARHARPRRLSSNLATAVTKFRSSDYVGVLNSGVAATITGYNATNPLGNSSLFPRAGNIAKMFMQFKFSSLTFRFVGRSTPTITANLCAVFLPNNGFGGAVTLTSEFMFKDTPGNIVVRAHQTRVLKCPCSSPWLSVDSNALASTVGASLGQLFTYVSATTAAGDAQWDLFVDYTLLFRGPIVAGQEN